MKSWDSQRYKDSLIHFFNTDLLSAYYTPGSVLDTKDAVVYKAGTVIALLDGHFSEKYGQI